ncbi:fasciclin-like arabinogalactan protein 2 [Primulina eburnea]|uniref:fasciclin-like arabinogalactan protein 2 n=1 Tax=Primulina eburnea TaxID=1245227 RepID=UPI003C6C362A
MQLRILILPLVLVLSATVHAHNITHILAGDPDLSTFNHYLTVTHLAAEINRRRTITVCAVDNAAMTDILSKNYPLYTIKNILSLHIFADYFSSKKLHQMPKGSITTSSLFQATGEAAGTSGYVDITDMKGGKVGFLPVDSSEDQPMATFVKTIGDLPYDISVIQISHILTSPEAEAPSSAPTDVNVTSLMVKQGCKAFSDLIRAEGVEETFLQSVVGGLTVFCPSDDALKSFMPSYKNLTSDGKTSVVLYHAIPTYNSLGMLRSSNGVVNTLATEGPNKYDLTVLNNGDNVKLETKVDTATIKGTLIDADPLSVFKIDRVLLPRQLFKADPLTKSKSAEAPGPSTDYDEAAADKISSNGRGRIRCGWFVMSLSSCLVIGILATIF